MNNISVEIKDNYSIGHFSAMACPCEILIESTHERHIQSLTKRAFDEAKRIEEKFSRYRDDNIIYQINHSAGIPIKVDEETALILDFARQCYELSDGKFDITSGVLRKIWTFDGSDNIPSQQQVEALKQQIGWEKINWEKPHITLPENMQIDLGGIGKEYAVDSTAKILAQHTKNSFLVNYGGDIACPRPRNNNRSWTIGVDDPAHTGENAAGRITLFHGALATSGDARRFLLRDGVRYSHILDPHTGYPVPDAPRSVTVVADTCIEAGMLSTFAMLQGNKAEAFLKEQGVKFWCIP
ncbi:FAD:protein FMN transferase [hydrothermal vent metagenome]|uniref:FAD:protein FMN transferase n=1 Tax=hydrothermal vent metagenome TaxID=652676 RepID=A0A3B0XG25_9ZZZZ